jgi:hypothetical protein
LSNYEDSKKGKKNRTTPERVKSKAKPTPELVQGTTFKSVRRKKKKETGREIAMMKEHGKVHRQQTPVPSHSIHSGDAVEERTEGRKCPEVSVFHHASLRDGELVNGCISCMPPKPAPEQKKVERKKTQGEKIRVTKGF